ncbi:hypothetical protein H0N98_02985 [Candidatus Micrarchaeota archaeon]|nr:hypothetical protein [Candidatus Micrarchaeota archaeon]
MECAYHPEKEAVATCSKCGRPLCEDCGGSPDTICIDCSILPSETEKEETAGSTLMRWNAWANLFISPNKVFKKSSKKASSAGIAMNLLVGLVNAGILAFLLFITGKPPPGESAGSIIGIFGYTTLFLILLAVWLAVTLVSYSFAMLVGGMGSLKQHIYMLSLVIPMLPFVILIIGGALWLLLLMSVAILILGAIFVTLYAMGILIAAIRETHRFGFVQAAVSGVIPVVVIGSAVGLLIFIFRNKRV